MPLLKSKYGTGLTAAKKTKLLEKIRLASAVKASRLQILKGKTLYRGNELSSFTIDETLSTGCLIIASAAGVIAASKVIQGLTYTAVALGTGGNSITITYVDPGVSAPLSVGVVGNAITVNLAHDGIAITSTANTVKAAIIASAPSSALVSVAGSGVSVLTTQVSTALLGGSNTSTFDKADIIEIKRLRTKKYKIILNGSANPAA